MFELPVLYDPFLLFAGRFRQKGDVDLLFSCQFEAMIAYDKLTRLTSLNEITHMSALHTSLSSYPRFLLTLWKQIEYEPT